MDKTLTINSYLKKSVIKQIPSIPKLTINPSYNITLYHNKIYPNINYKKMENKIISTEISTKCNNYKLINKNFFESPKKYLFKTIWTDCNSSLNKNRKTLFLKTTKTKFTKGTNRSQKVSMKILNDFFKPEITKSEKIIFTPKKQIRINKNHNNLNESKKDIPPNNYLYYYFPNLFNVPNNRVLGPQHLNSSKFFIAPIPKQSFKEEVKSLKVFRPVINNINENSKNLGSSISSNKKQKNTQKNPVFLEKLYNIDVLKNLRFGFKNSVERGKFNNLIKSFYTAQNLKFILPEH
jgi:hypothetical protein